MCEECFSLDEDNTQYTPVYQCSRTTCERASKIAQPCTGPNPCSMDDCARNCDGNVDNTAYGGEFEICTHFFSMISGGCILYSGCDEIRSTGEAGTTFAKVMSGGTTVSPTRVDSTADIATSCYGRCSGELERDHLDWCSCASDCGQYVNALDCCDDYEEACPLTLPPTTTSPDPFPGSWEQWGDCTQTCGSGKRFRACSTDVETDCYGDAVEFCNTDECTTTTTSTTRSNVKNSCVGRCGEGEDLPGDCICTDVCTSTFVPDECCNDYYARCVVDHDNGEDLVDPENGVDTGGNPATTDDPSNSIGNPDTIDADDDSVLTIVAWVVGGVAVLVVIILIVRCSCRPRKNQGYQRAVSANRNATTMVNHVEMGSVSSAYSHPRGDDFVTI